METQIKVIGELDKLLKESTSTTVLKPDISRFQRMAELINSKPTIPKEFVKLLKSRLAAAKHPKSQYLLLDLIEYTTCKCNIHLHNEYNSKVFLQQINAIFNQKMLTDEVRDKALFLIQFWHSFFISKADVLSSFSEYYNNIKKRGVQFPAKTQSDYFSANESPVKGAVIENRNQTYNVGPIVMAQDNNSFDTSLFTDKQKKLWNDLNVVVDNVVLANSLIDAKEWESLEEVMANLEAMERKLQMLPDKLQKADEEFLCNFAQALLNDLATSKNRYLAFNQGVRPEPFDSKTNAAIRKYNNANKNTIIVSDKDDYGFISKDPAPKPSSNNIGFNDFGDDGFGMPSNNNTNKISSKGFDDISNDFGPDIRAPYAQTDPFGAPESDFNFNNPKAQKNLKNDFDLLDLDAKPELKNQQLTFGSSPVNKTPFDMDFTSDVQRQPVPVETAFGIQPNKGTKFNPTGDVKFDKGDILFDDEPVHHDPFSNITDFNDFGSSGNNIKQKQVKKDDEFLF